MIADLLPRQTILQFGGAKIVLRYTILAELYIAYMGYSHEDIFAPRIDVKTIAVFLRATMMCSYAPENITLLQLDFTAIPPEVDTVVDIVTKGDKKDIVNTIREAIKASFPPPIVGAPKSNGGNIDYRELRCICCDILSMSEHDFMLSTIGEILDRYDRYAILKGYKKPPVKLSKYDKGVR